LRVIIAGVQVGAGKIYVRAVEAAQEKGKTGCNSVYNQNLVEKLVWVPVYFVL